MLPVDVRVHDVHQRPGGAQQRLTGNEVGVVRRASDPRFHLQRVFEIRLHLAEEPGLQVHVEGRFRVEAFRSE
jgi:hypothetical protein